MCCLAWCWWWSRCFLWKPHIWLQRLNKKGLRVMLWIKVSAIIQDCLLPSWRKSWWWVCVSVLAGQGYVERIRLVWRALGIDPCKWMGTTEHRLSICTSFYFHFVSLWSYNSDCGLFQVSGCAREGLEWTPWTLHAEDGQALEPDAREAVESTAWRYLRDGWMGH